MRNEQAGNGQRTNNTILFAVAALLGSSGWAYATLAGDDATETRQAISRHDGELKVLRYQVDQLQRERDQERDRRRDD